MYKLKREQLEDMLANAQMRPEVKETHKGWHIFVGDGFSMSPEVHYKRFGAEPGDFDFGAYCTMWVVGPSAEKLTTGAGMLFDFGHDPHLDQDQKKEARIRTAINDAVTFIERLEKVKREGIPKHA